jgi:hypothetical protein
VAKFKKKKRQQDEAPKAKPRPGDTLRYTPRPQEGVLVQIWPDGTHQCITEDGGWFEAWDDEDDEIELVREATDESKLLALREVVSQMRTRHDHFASQGKEVVIKAELVETLEKIVGRPY